MDRYMIDSGEYSRPTGRLSGSGSTRRPTSQIIFKGLALAAVLTCLIAPAAEAQRRYGSHRAGTLRVRLGLFEPEGDSEFWDAQFQDFTGDVADLEDMVAGVDYLWPIGRTTSLAFGVGAWEGETTQGYRDFTDQAGNAIRHQTSLQTTDLTVALQYRLGSRDARFSPYLGIGAGFVWWRLEETGDFIDFATAELPVVFAFYRADGTTTEVFALAGLEIELTPGWAFLAEARWKEADDELGDDYGGFGKIDLGGRELTAGFSFRF